MAISAPRAAPRPFGASVVITTSDYPHSWPTPATDRGSCIGSTSKKLSKDQGVGAVKFFTGESHTVATATAIVAQRVAADRARSDLSARHDSSKAIMSSQSSATKSHLGAAGIGLFVLYWLMHPTVTANSGLAGYRPPPKTIVMLFREQVPQVGFIEYNGTLEVHNSLLNIVLHEKLEIKTRDEQSVRNKFCNVTNLIKPSLRKQLCFPAQASR